MSVHGVDNRTVRTIDSLRSILVIQQVRRPRSPALIGNKTPAAHPIVQIEPGARDFGALAWRGRGIAECVETRFQTNGSTVIPTENGPSGWGTWTTMRFEEGMVGDQEIRGKDHACNSKNPLQFLGRFT